MTEFILIMLFINLALTLSLCVFAMNTCAKVNQMHGKIKVQDDSISDLLEIILTDRGGL